MKRKNELLDALIMEIENRKHEAVNWKISSIYFGGGTPSVLSIEEINKLLKCIYVNYDISDKPEITLEANPEDLTQEYLFELRDKTKVNRLSIGVQSFYDKHLELMNRHHTGLEAYNSIVRAKRAGFNNMNVDLIYAVPGMSTAEWKENLGKLKALEVAHFSAYHLTFEPKTVFAYYRKKGNLKPVPEKESLQHFELLMDFIDNTEYEQYEISNFAKGAQYSRHNLGYWTGMKYLGFGPSAHSFTSDTRKWNRANNTEYIECMQHGSDTYYESETITPIKAFNEYVLTALRTKWGIQRNVVVERFGENMYLKLYDCLTPFINDGQVEEINNCLCLTVKGKLIADYIMTELMEVEDE